MGRSNLDLARLRQLFLETLNLPEDQRTDFLDRLEIGEDLREELRALLLEDQEAESFLRRTVENARPSAGIGERFGPFETRALLGRGGMGAVYRAERTDGELNQTVAVKVVERGWLAPRALERFRKERQFLAGLVHPGIARLIDGGTRSDGVPYLVMEYVDGLSLDQYCERHRLSIRDRLRLFLPLCDALDYAHQNLVIHRDLKPSNVLVTAKGEPKLLDFGVAKALDAAEGSRTQTLVFTPDFASPEQARGEDATTATDVYGLGAVLYYLLTGKPPHSTEGLSTAEMQRTIAEAPPVRPSIHNRQLKGDLENILMKSLHAAPLRRYRSARELAQDIENYLAQRPVLATPDSWAYRTGRFVHRNRIASLASGLALVAIVGGSGFSLYEARREQHRAAQVRTLSNRFIFDFEEAIIDTPGTLAAQKMVVSTAREYLANLAEDARNDPGLKRDLAQSYYRLSGVEVRLGDSNAGITHLNRSLEILKDLKDDCCGAAPQRKLYVDDLIALSSRQVDTRAVKEAERTMEQAVDAARRWVQQSPHDSLAGRTLFDALEQQGIVLSDAGQQAEARQVLEEAVRVIDAYPPDKSVTEKQAEVRLELASTLHSLGEYNQALEVVRAGEAKLDALIAGSPENNTWRSSRIKLASLRSRVLTRLAVQDASILPQALEAGREAYTMARSSAAANPKDLSALDLAATMAGRHANQLIDANRIDESLVYQREAARLLEEMLQVAPENRRNLYLKANNSMMIGYNLSRLSRWQEALASLNEAEKMGTLALSQEPNDLRMLQTKNGVLMMTTRAERNLGRLDEARRYCRAALVSSQDLIARNKQAKEPVAMIEILHSEAKLLGIPDTTLH